MNMARGWRQFLIPAFLVLLAFALRIVGAEGDLAQDELTSLKLISGLTNPLQIFYAINNDNNHFLNSLWLWIVGPDAAILLKRGLSILEGTATVAVLGLWQWRRGREAACIAMTLGATSYFMVLYGSEARGYAGLILFSMLGAWALEEEIAGRCRRAWLTAAIVLGFASQFLMLFAVIAYAAAIVMDERRRGGKFDAVMTRGLTLLGPGVALSACMLAPTLYSSVHHRFFFGSLAHFGGQEMLNGLGMSLQTTVDLWFLHFPMAYDLLAAIITTAIAFLVPPLRRGLYLGGVLAGPALGYLAGFPNTGIPRYHTVCATIWLMTLADGLALLVARRGLWRVPVYGLILALTAGNLLFLQRLHLHQRGHYGLAVAAMTANGPATYGLYRPVLHTLFDDVVRRTSAPLRYEPPAEICNQAPEWFVYPDLTQTPPADEMIFGQPLCGMRYRLVTKFDYFGLTGIGLDLYRRDP